MPLSSFAELIGPVAVKDWLQLRGQEHLYIPGRASKSEGLIDWSEVSHLVEQRLGATTVHLSLDRKRHPIAVAPEKSTDLPVGNLYEQLREGAALVIDRADDAFPRVRTLVEGIEREVKAVSGVNLYASWGHAEGFGPHWDQHDVFVIQVHGHKRWQLFGPTTVHPLVFDKTEPPPSTIQHEYRLSPGDVLYVPRGHWHNVFGEDGPSLHLTLGLWFDHGLELLDWLRLRIKDSEIFRRDLPLLGTLEERRAHAARLRQELFALWPEDILDDYWNARSGRTNARGRVDLEGVLATDPLPEQDRFQIGSSLAVFGPLTVSGRSVEFQAARQQWRVNVVFAPLLEALRRGPVAFSALHEMAPRLTRAQLRTWLGSMVKQGLFHVLPEDSEAGEEPVRDRPVPVK